jgi:hypothetical protein
MPAHAFLDNPVGDVSGGSKKGKKIVVLALFALSVSRLSSLRGLSIQKSSDIKYS